MVAVLHKIVISISKFREKIVCYQIGSIVYQFVNNLFISVIGISAKSHISAPLLSVWLARVFAH